MTRSNTFFCSSLKNIFAMTFFFFLLTFSVSSMLSAILALCCSLRVFCCSFNALAVVFHGYCDLDESFGKGVKVLLVVTAADFRFFFAKMSSSGSGVSCCLGCGCCDQGKARRLLLGGCGLGGVLKCSTGEDDHGMGWLLSSSILGCTDCGRDEYPESFVAVGDAGGSFGYVTVPFVAGSSMSRSMSLSKSSSSNSAVARPPVLLRDGV
ncbi:hypothetical protein M3J09_011041 [Ascochyta lentis]